MGEAFDLSRFIKAQEQDFQIALEEVRNGRKTSHWMWYVFPQIIGLGQSRTSIFYSIHELDEAKAYMADPILGAHMNEICEVLMEIPNNDATYIFGTPDDLKLKSSMTLFRAACPENGIFEKVLDKFFAGEGDRRTIELISWRESIK